MSAKLQINFFFFILQSYMEKTSGTYTVKTENSLDISWIPYFSIRKWAMKTSCIISVNREQQQQQQQ